ncbi:MAG: cytochrome c [Halieaceae bacterium]|nr:cytochrome c [Halieaceae bacterium]
MDDGNLVLASPNPQSLISNIHYPNIQQPLPEVIVNRMIRRFIRIIPFLGVALIAVAVYLMTSSVTSTQTVHALPEYADRTGESCSTCHVNPGGGGPRTLRGMLWSARGRTDAVPELPGVLLAPGISDGAELWDIACASCHGLQGEGGFGTTITGSGLSANKIGSAVKRGRERSGMPPYEGQFTDDQVDALVDFTQGIANGIIAPPPPAIPLPAAEFTCQSQTAPVSCGGN